MTQIEKMPGWLIRARAALTLARQEKPADALWEDQCFLAQQAAERAMKAVHISAAIPFRFTHDIEELGKCLEDNGLNIPQDVRDSVILTRYAVETRYPGPAEPVTAEEYDEAIRLADSVVVWAENTVLNP